MSDNATAATPASTTEGELPELTLSNLTDERIFEIEGFEDLKPSAPAPATEAPATPQADAATSPEATPEALLDQAELDKLSTAETPESATPAASPETSEYIKKLTQVLPNEEAANYAIDAFTRQTQLEQAVQTGNIAAALQAMPSVGNLVKSAIVEYVKANQDKIVEDYIRKNSPENQNPEVEGLKQQVQKLTDILTQGSKQAETQKTQQEQTNRLKAIDSEVTRLFDVIRFTKNEADRDVVADLFRVELSKNPEALKKALGGDLNAVRPVFSKVVKRYVDLDKAKRIPPPTTETTTAAAVIGRGGIASTETPDVWEQAAAWVAEHPSNGRKG